MKINLRKAAAVQEAIMAEIRLLSREDETVRISLFDEFPQSLLDQRLNEITETFERTARLMEAYRFLRAAVARKNAEVGIVDYLAEDSMLTAMEPKVEAITRMTVRPNLDHLSKELRARRDSSEEKVSIYGSGREFTVAVPVMDQKTVDQAESELERLRRRRRKIRDEMVAINVKTEIEVPEQVAIVLAELGLD